MRQLKGEYRQLNLDDWANRVPAEEDAPQVISTPFELYDEGGNLRLVYIELPDRMEDLRSALASIRYDEEARTSGLVTRSRVFGYQPRITIRRDYCTATKMASEHPHEHRVVTRYARLVEKHYLRHNPKLYGEHALMGLQNLKDKGYRLGGTAFTSGIINDANPLKYHFDNGNYEGVWSGMLTLRSGVQGGDLALPEWGFRIALRDRSLLLFDGQGMLHGVTPIHVVARGGYRRTVVYYSLRGMWQCEPIKRELERIRALRTTREEKRGGRMQ